MLKDKAKIYEHQLQYIPGLNNSEKFTQREVDVIACLINKKLNSQISTLLGIGVDGVETHIRNIMIKIDCASREEIINFIRKSGKLRFLEEIYIHIELEHAITEQFKIIKKQLLKNKITCAIWCNNNKIKQNTIFKKFYNYCSKELNITLLLNPNPAQNINCHFYILSHSNLTSFTDDKNYLVFEEIDIESNNVINFGKKLYFMSIFSFLKTIIGEEIILPYYNGTQAFYTNFNKKLNDLYVEVQKQNINHKNFIKKQFTILGCIVLFTIVITISILSVTSTKHIVHEKIIASNFSLPHQKLLLSRKHLLEKIDKILAAQDGIKIAVIAGIGGSGKTTLSYEYTKLHVDKASIVWEFNAENNQTLFSSLKQLAFALCDNNTERTELLQICNIDNLHEQNEKLERFLSNKVINYPNWLIIYDNVKAFDDIKWYFPVDIKAWGPGRVIINTTDLNMLNNPLIPKENILDIGELSSDEKLSLFTNILYNHKEITLDNEDVIKFLKHIPPFPLDVELAASYIRDQKVTFEEYLKNLATPTHEFTTIQENILIDMGAYAQTRYKIIATSIEKLARHKDFRDLLLFISLLDAKNIPQSLLVSFKDKVTVSKLVSELKKYALIMEDNQDTIPIFSVYRCTQQGILAYLNIDDISHSPDIINPMTEILEKYMDQEYENYNMTESYIIASSAEKFLEQSKLSNQVSQLGIVTALGQYYLFLGNYTKASLYLKHALNLAEKFYNSTNPKMAKIQRLLGNLYREQGNYAEAHKFLESSYKIYSVNYGNNNILSLNCKIDLATTYIYLEEYEKAQFILEDILNTYQNYPHAKIKIAEIQSNLSHVYNLTGNYELAKKFAETSITNTQSLLGTEHISTIWTTLHLANIYKDLSYYKKAKTILKNGIDSYTKIYGDNHVKIAFFLETAANIELAQQNYTEAEKLFNEALNIYKTTNHGKIYTCFESLAAIYMAKSTKNIDQQKNYHFIARNYLVEALNYRKLNFLDNPKVIQNLLAKIHQLEEVM